MRIMLRLPIVSRKKYDELEHKLECLLRHATGGRYSEAGYSLTDMCKMVNEHIYRRIKYSEVVRLWGKNLALLRTGALGDDTSPETLLRYWKSQERAGYPNASENVKYFEDMIRKESEKNEKSL